MDDKVGCFNTGLYDKTWQPIYFYCIKNPIEGFQEWRFTAFYNSYTIKFTDIPTSVVSDLQRASYFANPRACLKIHSRHLHPLICGIFLPNSVNVARYASFIWQKSPTNCRIHLSESNFQTRSSALIYDIKLDIIPQWDHILYEEENFLRIPEQLRANGREFCQNLIEGAIGSVKKRIEANYKTVVPQLYNGKIQLLAPLYLTNPDKPDLALVLSFSDDETVYYGHTCLTTEMAYNNARLIARPDSYWLQP